MKTIIIKIESEDELIDKSVGAFCLATGWTDVGAVNVPVQPDALLDFESIVSTLFLDAALASENLLRLTNLHVVESTAGVFAVSPSLRVAIERDRRIKLSNTTELEAMKKLAASLTIRIEEGNHPLTPDTPSPHRRYILYHDITPKIPSGFSLRDVLAITVAQLHHVSGHQLRTNKYTRCTAYAPSVAPK